MLATPEPLGFPGLFMLSEKLVTRFNAWKEREKRGKSGIAIEALLRCGLHQEPRVVKAINTLLKMSPAGNWCGCGYFDTRNINFVPDGNCPPPKKEASTMMILRALKKFDFLKLLI